jgi:hypothetical protein
MCENRERKFVVPKQSSAGKGLWIAQVIGICEPRMGMNGGETSLVEVSILRVQNEEYRFNEGSFFATGPFFEFDTEAEALAHIESMGVIVSA